MLYLIGDIDNESIIIVIVNFEQQDSFKINYQLLIINYQLTMLSLLTIFSSIIISVSGLLSFCTIHVTPSTPLLASILHFSGNPPANLGVNEGNLSKCPDSPNCVVSQASDDEEHFIEPLDYGKLDREEAYQAFVKILSVVPDTEIVEQTDNYIHTESSSKLMGFVDDAEFYFPEDSSVVQWRSSARMGESDLGVNRRRLEQIRLAFEDYVNN